jgi:hypothetical protein
MRKVSLFCLISILFFLVVSCGDNSTDAGDPPLKNDSTYYDVTYTDNTILIDGAALSSIVDVDTANYVYTFMANEPKLANVKTGDILLIHGLALRKVSVVNELGDNIEIETEYATLNEAIKDGTISWNKQIDFKKGVVPSVMMKGNLQTPRVTADGFDFEFKYGEFTYHIVFSFAETKADITFEITKDVVKNVTAKFTAKGKIEQFNSETNMEYQNQELMRFGQKNTNMKGDLTLNLTVAGSGRDNITFDFPVVLLKYPVLVGPIPVFINVKVLFVLNCVVPVDGSSQVEVKFSYNSVTGIKYENGTVSADASMGDQNMDKNKAQTGASSAIGANFGLAFPRLEIGVFDEVIVPWIQTAFLIGGDYTFTPPCQQARSQFIGACGLDLSFLGFGYSANKTLWQMEKILMKSGDCP